MKSLSFSFLALLISSSAFSATKNVRCVSVTPGIELSLDGTVSDVASSRFTVHYAGGDAALVARREVSQNAKMASLRNWKFSEKGSSGLQELTLVVSDTTIYSANFLSVDAFGEDRMEVRMKCSF